MHWGGPADRKNKQPFGATPPHLLSAPRPLAEATHNKVERGVAHLGLGLAAQDGGGERRRGALGETAGWES